jgi:taurine--2-oxoglutarate transaminase
MSNSNPSLSTRDIVKLNKEYTFFSWSVQSATNPIPITRAKGIYFWDADGKRYIDFSSQLMNMNIGHQHPKVIKAIQLNYVMPILEWQLNHAAYLEKK